MTCVKRGRRDRSRVPPPLRCRPGSGPLGLAPPPSSKAVRPSPSPAASARRSPPAKKAAPRALEAMTQTKTRLTGAPKPVAVGRRSRSQPIRRM